MGEKKRLSPVPVFSQKLFVDSDGGGGGGGVGDGSGGGGGGVQLAVYTLRTQRVW